MRILAIETSCDETAVAIADFSGTKRHPHIRIRANIVSSQVKLHAKFGGVVPNLAKREHQKNLVPILLRALKKSDGEVLKIKKLILRMNKNSFLNTKYEMLNAILEREPELLKRFKKYVVPLRKPNIDAIAVTYGPGLAPALWVGVNFAKALAILWGKPIMPIHHMLGHLYSSVISTKASMNKKSILRAKRNRAHNAKYIIPNTIHFPAIVLLASGGHTELVLMQRYGKYKIIGETLDDAAGEAFDKVARLLGLGYPGGPAIAALAEKIQNAKNKTQNHTAKFKIILPRPMIKSSDYNFSFSGLKTAVLYLLRDHPELAQSVAGKSAVAKEFQKAVTDVLVAKTVRAAKTYRAKTILLGGGVAANKTLRAELSKHLQKELPKTKCQMPEAALTGDNALMIALAAFFEKKKPLIPGAKFSANAHMRLE